MAANAEFFAAQRQFMVDGQLRTRGVTDLRLLAAFSDIAREAFVAPDFVGLAYLDRQVPALGATNRRLLEPASLAKLLQAASVRSGERALEVAGGSGYGSSLLAQLGAKTVLLEDDAGALAGAKGAMAAGLPFELVSGDLAAGAPRLAPFDVILVSCGFESDLDGLTAQLAPKGRLVGIDASSGMSSAVLIEKSASGFSRRVLFEASAPVAEAFRRKAAFVF